MATELSLFVVKGNEIEYLGFDLTAETAYSFFRTAVYDGQIPLIMPIGFSVGVQAGFPRTAIDKPAGVFDSIAAINGNVKDLIFVFGENASSVSSVNCRINSSQSTGLMTSGNVQWSDGDSDFEALDKTKELLRSKSPTSLRLFVKKGIGYRSMEENAKELKRFSNNTKMGGMSPLNTYFSLTKYLKVPPYDGAGIKIRYANGLTPQLFERILRYAEI